MTTDRVEAFLADILSGPAELAAVLEAQRRVVADVPVSALVRPTWRFVGMGSSRFAAMDAASRLRSAGNHAHALLASAAERAPGGRDTLLVAISASGSTPEVLATVERDAGASFVLGLTGQQDSPLARLSDVVIPLSAAHPVTAGIACLTYRAAIAALQVLGGARDPDMAPPDPAVAVAGLEALLATRGAWQEQAADVLDGAREIHVLADGSRAGVAEQAALMLREGPRLAAVAFDTAEWLHVGLYTLFPGDPVLLLCGSPADASALDTVRARGGRVVAVGPFPAGARVDVHGPLPDAAVADPSIRALVEPAVAELLAVELWRRTRGAEPGARPGRRRT
jgi:glucosamine--fructose-6-phosphate aminotransferase (isomerizing)